MPYTAPTLTQAQTALATRLDDPTMVRWVAPELTVYLREALRTWSAWTAFWRDQGSFATQMLVPFYDLATELPTLRARTITNWELVTDLQYALLEPAAAGGTWTGTDQFTLAQLNEVIQSKRDEFLADTGLILTRVESAPAIPPASGRINLDEVIRTVRRVAWRPTAMQLLQPLIRSDEWAANHFSPTWLTDGTTEPPYAYSVTAVPPITLQLIPPPPVEGTLDLISVNRGGTIDPLVASSLGVDDDWAWVIKFGALAELLQYDGLALDPVRAAYCQSRWQQGIELAKKSPVLLTARIDDVPVRINSLADLDSYQPLWQLVGGAPEEVGLAGHNLLCTVPPPGSALFTITLDVVRNAPVPSVGADVLQVSADVYDAILDYAQHLAVFKEGAGPLATAQALLERAMSAAGMDLMLQQASQPSRRPLVRQQRQDEDASPRELEPAGTE